MPKPFPIFASNHTRVLLIVGILVVGFMLLNMVFIQVGPGQRGVLMTFGAVQKGVLDPGLHMRIPFVQTIKLLDVRIQKSEEPQTAASKDLQDVTTKVAVNWSIDPKDAQWVYQQIGDEDAMVAKIIEPAVANTIKAVTAQYNAEELVEKRNQIRQQINDQIITTLAAYKVTVQAVNITNFSFSPEYAQAIEQKQVAQQKAQQAEYDLQRVKVEAQQRVADAEGQSQAQKLMQSTLTPDFIQYQAVQKWNGVLPQVVGGQGTMPLLDLRSGGSAGQAAPAK